MHHAQSELKSLFSCMSQIKDAKDVYQSVVQYAVAFENVTWAALALKPHYDEASIYTFPKALPSEIETFLQDIAHTQAIQHLPSGVMVKSLKVHEAKAWLVIDMNASADDLEVIAAAAEAVIAFHAMQTRLDSAEALGKRRLQEVAALYELSRSLESSDFSMLLQAIVTKACSVMDAQACSLLLRRDESNSLYIAASHGLEQYIIDKAKIKIGEGIAGTVAQTGKPMLIGDPANHPDLKKIPLKTKREISSSMCAPLINWHGGVFGVLTLRRFQPLTAFDEGDLQVFGIFAGLCALAYTNAQLYNRLKLRIREIQDLSAQQKSILSSISTGVISLSENIVITSWNEAAEQLFQLPAKKAINNSFETILKTQMTGDDVASLVADIEMVNAGGGKTNKVYELTSKAFGAIALSCTISPMKFRENHSSGLVVTIDDITEQLALERQMADMQRLADIGRMTAVIAHEIRNPLTGIKGAAQFLSSSEELGEGCREFVDIIKDEADSLSRIAGEFLEYAKPYELTLEGGNINELIKDIADRLRATAHEHKVDIDCILDSSVPIMKYDRHKLIQAFRNLMLNGIQAMPNGGLLTAKTQFLQGDKAVQVKIRDTGSGIANETLDKLFTPFFTTKTKGSGLGLSIVKKIISAHDGKVTAENASPVGAEFSVTLPWKKP